jgi:hypothetical protein
MAESAATVVPGPPMGGRSTNGLPLQTEAFGLVNRQLLRRTTLIFVGGGAFLMVVCGPYALFLFRNQATQSEGAINAIAAVIGVLTLVYGIWIGRQFSPDKLQASVSSLEVIEHRALGSGERRHVAGWDELTLSPPEPSGWGSVIFGKAIFDLAGPSVYGSSRHVDQLRVPPSIYARLATYLRSARTLASPP